MIERLFLRHGLKLLVLLAFAGLIVTNLLTRSALETARADLRAEKAQTGVLSDRLKAQSNAITALKQAAVQNREVYLAGIDAANRRAVRLEIKASDILNIPIPSDPQKACEVADRILEGVTK